jgi:hypothetical protein
MFMNISLYLLFWNNYITPLKALSAPKYIYDHKRKPIEYSLPAFAEEGLNSFS